MEKEIEEKTPMEYYEDMKAEFLDEMFKYVEDKRRTE